MPITHVQRITLAIAFDPDKIPCPSEWKWHSLLDLGPNERLLRVEASDLEELAPISKEQIEAAIKTLDELFEPDPAPIVVGESYVFNYPEAFVTLPDYSARRGQVVTVVRQCTPEEAYQEEERMWVVRAPDGWEGEAWESELVPVGTKP